MLRVVLVSPLPAVRAGLRAMLGAADDVEVVGEAAEYRLDAPRTGGPDPDVVVLDLSSDGDLAGLLSAEWIGPGPRPLILGAAPADEALPAELADGPWGYLPRDAGPDQLIAAVRAVGSGLVALDPSIGKGVLARAEIRLDGSVDRDTTEELTTREREVLELVALGLPNKAIAARLAISEHTAKFHVAAILAKLGAGSRTEAVHLAARRGLVAL